MIPAHLMAQGDSSPTRAAALGAGARHRNCFYYFRGPAARSGTTGAADRQIEDNTTKALINVLEHSDPSVLKSFAALFAPVSGANPAAEPQFFLQRGPQSVSATQRGLLAISPDGEISDDSLADEGAGSRVDAAIYVPGSWLIVIEVKTTTGTLYRDQLLRHSTAWEVEPVLEGGETGDSQWRVVTWREIYEWARRERESRHAQPSEFLLDQLTEYLELAGLAPTSRFLPEHFDFFAGRAADRPDDLRAEIRTRLETIWELVKDDLGDLRPEIEPTYVGPIRARDSNAWAQSHRDRPGVNLTIELDVRGLQLNIVAGTAKQLGEFESWLDSERSRHAAGAGLRGYRLFLFARKATSRRADGTPMWRAAQWTEAGPGWPIETATTPAGRREIAAAAETVERAGALRAFHVRRSWAREEVIDAGDELIVALTREIENIVSIVSEIRGS